jgi:hypothetical protein
MPFRDCSSKSGSDFFKVRTIQTAMVTNDAGPLRIADEVDLAKKVK